MSDDDAVSDSFFDVSELPSEEAQESDPLVGTVLDGRYRLDRLLGEGGMGRVYAGTQLSVGRAVAIKLLRGEALAQREVKERFLREAQVISGFSHPNIVRLIDYGEDTERRLPYLVMELVRGVSLGDLTRRGRLDLTLALEIVYQVCGALVQAHSAGIIHRDLKPDNLQLMPVVGDSFQAKVLDFGIAFPRDTDSRITSTGMICGTAYYIAPEQARAMELDGRADLYALGIILYQMLSGHLPFRGDSDFQILLMQVQEAPPALSDYLPPDEVPPEVIKLVHDLLEKDPNHRPPSARAVRERIEAIRTRCAISPLRLDLENASADAFERWILEPAQSAPIVEASTALDASTPPDVRDKLAGRRQTMVEEETTGVSPQTSPPEDSEESGAASEVASPNQAHIIAALAVAIIAAGGVALYLWHSQHDPGADEPGELAAGQGDGANAADPAGEPADGRDDDAPGADSAPTVALSAFEGRCTVIGESDTWFHTVFLYPEVGELMLHGDERLLWSPLEVTRHTGQTLEFNYHRPDTDSDAAPDTGSNHKPDAHANDRAADDRPQLTSVRTSGDKLIFGLADDTPTRTKSKFVCRKHDVQKYYDTLGISGTFQHTDDESRQASVPSSGQRIELADGEYVYRILEGATLADGHALALREAKDSDAPWKRGRVAFDEDGGLLTIELDGQTEHYRSKEAAKRAREQAARREREEAATRKKAARERARAAKQPAPTRAPEADDSQDAHELPPHLRPAPQRVYDKFYKKVRASVDRYCDVMDERSAQVAHHQKLVDEKRYDEAKTYRDEVLNDTAAYSQKIQAASYGYSHAVQSAAQSGLNSVQIQKLTRVWQKGCE